MQRLYFEEFSAEIDESRCHGLYRGHEPVGLSDAPRKVLFILLQHRPRPVTGKALLAALWHAGANPSNVAKQVRALRVAMGDERAGRYIRTLNKEGYAFVMPVTGSPVDVPLPVHAAQPGLPTRTEPPPIARATPGASDRAASPGVMEWHLATEKLAKDFRGSCLHDLELLDEAIEECDRRVHVIANHKRMRLHSRFPHEPIFVPPRSMVGARWATPDALDGELASRAAALVAHSQTTPIAVNVGSYSPACIAVLQSLQRRYGLNVRCDIEGLSGRQQILRLAHDDESDFLIAPHAPFLLVGDYHALDYRWVTPIHAYQQVVLGPPGVQRRGRKSRLLVYKGGSPEEQLIAGVGIPATAEPEMVASLERLLTMVPELAPGDLVIAWEPLASGLESQYVLRRSAEFRCWLSLYCHKRWQRGALQSLKNQFRQLFAAEWVHCMHNRAWALECLALELRSLEYFAAGSGLAPSPWPPA